MQKALAMLPEGGARHLASTIADYEARLQPLQRAEPILDGSEARSVADAFAPMGAKMRPDMSQEQAMFWAASLVKAFSDLPAFIVRAALDDAIHIPFAFPTDMEAKVREIAERKLEAHRTAIRRLQAMRDEIHRAAHPPQAQLAAPEPDRPWTAAELHKLSANLRAMGIAGGWLTQAQLDEADAEFAKETP